VQAAVQSQTWRRSILSEFRNLRLQDWKPAIARHWTRDSDGYNRWVLHCLRSQTYRRPFEAIFSRVFGDEPLKLLDVGAGPGVLAFLLTGLGHRVTGIDLSPGMLKQAHQNAALLGLNVEFQPGDAEQLPFPDESFDGLASRLVLWNLPNPERALAEWARVLRPGGKLVIIDVDMQSIRREWWWRKPLHVASAPLVMLTERRNPLKNQMSGQDIDKLPMSHVARPDWEIAELAKLGFTGLRVERVNRASVGWMEFLKYGCWGDYIGLSGVKSGVSRS
jgi:ubiquinone/menaquinone biosynthesis C-methylase UbiE